MGKETTIIYYTDGHISDSIASLVRKYISKSGNPIISVSQKPMDFGENICIGNIGRSYRSIQFQVLAGALASSTKYVALAEHDTLYPEGYFDWVPPGDNVFYYNRNRVFAVAKKGPQYGMYIIYRDANPNADQLICNRRLLIKATKRRLKLLDSHKPLPPGWGEPGFAFDDEKWEWRNNEIASIDIFHNKNFTVRHGIFSPDEISWDIKGWGKFKDVLCTA